MVSGEYMRQCILVIYNTLHICVIVYGVGLFQHTQGKQQLLALQPSAPVKLGAKEKHENDLLHYYIRIRLWTRLDFYIVQVLIMPLLFMIRRVCTPMMQNSVIPSAQKNNVVSEISSSS